MGINQSAQTIHIIFEGKQKEELFSAPDKTIEELFNEYTDLFKYKKNFDFIFNGAKIDKSSKDLVGNVFINNCTIQVLEK